MTIVGGFIFPLRMNEILILLNLIQLKESKRCGNVPPRFFFIMEEQMEKYFEYLDRLRHSGVTNMYGARPYLQKEFPELGFDPKRASEILRAWMNRYRTEGGADES